MKISDLNKKETTFALNQGDFVKLYEKIPEEFKNDAGMESAIKEISKLLVQNHMIQAPSEDVEVIPYGRKYIIMHGTNELYQIEYASLT